MYASTLRCDINNNLVATDINYGSGCLNVRAFLNHCSKLLLL
jgi:hypothetical protein